MTQGMVSAPRPTANPTNTRRCVSFFSGSSVAVRFVCPAVLLAWFSLSNIVSASELGASTRLQLLGSVIDTLSNDDQSTIARKLALLGGDDDEWRHMMPLANEFARLRREASFGNFEKIGTTAAGKYFFASAFSLFAGDSPHILLVRYRLAGNGRYYLHSMKLVHRTSEVLELLSPLGLLKKME